MKKRVNKRVHTNLTFDPIILEQVFLYVDDQKEFSSLSRFIEKLMKDFLDKREESNNGK